MGLFDKLFGKKKQAEEQPAPKTAENPETQNAAQPAVPETAPVVQNTTPAVPLEDIEPAPAGIKPDDTALRALTAKVMPQDPFTAEAQKHIVKDIATVTGMYAEPVVEAIDMLWAAPNADGKLSTAKVAMALAENLSHTQPTDAALQTVDPVLLIRSWRYLDVYAAMLQEKQAGTLLALRDRIRDMLVNRKILQVRKSTGLERMQLQLAKQVQEKAAPEAIRETAKAIYAELKQQETLLVAYDEDHSNKFPFAGGDGALQLFTSKEKSAQIAAALSASGDGHFSVKEVKKEQLEQFLIGAAMTGFPAVRIYTQGAVSVLPLRDILPGIQACMVDMVNCSVRGLALRMMQYNARINKLNASLRGGEKHKQLTAGMLTMRANLLREIGNGLVYVLGPGPYTPGVTLYTPDAMARAREILEKTKMPEESMIAPGDTSIAAYEGKLALRAMPIPNAGGELKQANVCAFTQRGVCEAARKHFAQNGASDSVIVVTWDELAAQAESCAGIVLDPALLATGIPTAWFPEVEKFRTFKSPVVVNLQEKNNPPDTANA